MIYGHGHCFKPTPVSSKYSMLMLNKIIPLVLAVIFVISGLALAQISGPTDGSGYPGVQTPTPPRRPSPTVTPSPSPTPVPTAQPDEPPNPTPTPTVSPTPTAMP